MGCGTGKLAQLLNLNGFTNIRGIDASQNMLFAAEKTGLYKELYQVELGNDALPANFKEQF